MIDKIASFIGLVVTVISIAGLVISWILLPNLLNNPFLFWIFLVYLIINGLATIWQLIKIFDTGLSKT